MVHTCLTERCAGHGLFCCHPCKQHSFSLPLLSTTCGFIFPLSWEAMLIQPPSSLFLRHPLSPRTGFIPWPWMPQLPKVKAQPRCLFQVQLRNPVFCSTFSCGWTCCKTVNDYQQSSGAFHRTLHLPQLGYQLSSDPGKTLDPFPQTPDMIHQHIQLVLIQN